MTAIITAELGQNPLPIITAKYLRGTSFEPRVNPLALIALQAIS